MEELKKGISRRNLLKGATLSAAGVAALGMFGCSPAGGSSSSSSKADAAGESKHTWEVAPRLSPISPKPSRPKCSSLAPAIRELAAL